jgi:L-amino acid N-acyltransferase YncA
LLEKLISISESESYWTLQAQILAPNKASRALHAKRGFREVGYRERFGHINGAWLDVILMERRSDRTGGPGLPTRSCD